MYFKSASAVFAAVRMLFRRWSTLPLMIAIYGALLLTLYLFISTREATVTQLIVTFVMLLAASVLFFVLQSASVNYTNESPGLLRKTLLDTLKLIAVSVPAIALTVLVVYVVGKLQGGIAVNPETSQPASPNTLTTLTVIRYLVLGFVAPLVTIQLWIGASARGLRGIIRNLRETIAGAFAPQAVFIFACGFLFFAVVPYFLLARTFQIERAWLEVSLFTVRVVISALFVLLGWVTTIGALSILNARSNEMPVTQS
jgi:hypothetical protein